MHLLVTINPRLSCVKAVQPKCPRQCTYLCPACPQAQFASNGSALQDTSPSTFVWYVDSVAPSITVAAAPDAATGVPLSAVRFVLVPSEPEVVIHYRVAPAACASDGGTMETLVPPCDCVHGAVWDNGDASVTV